MIEEGPELLDVGHSSIAPLRRGTCRRSESQSLSASTAYLLALRFRFVCTENFSLVVRRVLQSKSAKGIAQGSNGQLRKGFVKIAAGCRSILKTCLELEKIITLSFYHCLSITLLTLSRASMGKSTVYGRWGLRHLNFVFNCHMATRFRMKLRIELFFTVIKSFWGVHAQVLAEIFAQR